MLTIAAGVAEEFKLGMVHFRCHKVMESGGGGAVVYGGLLAYCKLVGKSNGLVLSRIGSSV